MNNKSRWPVMFLTTVFLAYALNAPAADKEIRYPHGKMNTWGVWGNNDQKGAANYMTPETLIAAAKLIKTGKTFSLAIPLDNNGPVYPGRLSPFHMMVITGNDYENKLVAQSAGLTRFADDYIFMPLHGSTHWDALSHTWYENQLYNGSPQQGTLTAPILGGATRLGIENIRDSMIGRGILIDILRYKGGTLPKGYGITRADIEGALAKQKTIVRQGDIVMLRTGVVPQWYSLKTLVEKATFYEEAKTGIVKDVVPWIKEFKIAAIAADNLSVEKMPNEDDPAAESPLHGNILRDLGVYMGEMFWLEEIAEDCAKDGRYEFFLMAQPLNITGGIGSPLNPIAIK